MGSGKTSVVREFIARGNFEVEFIEVFGKKLPYTIDKSRNIIITGRYDIRICGGVDGIIKNKHVCTEYLMKLIRLNANVIVFEGVMYGMTFKFSNDLNNLCKLFKYNYIAIDLFAPFDVVINRILGRNGGKPIKVEAVEKQYTRGHKATQKLISAGVNAKFVDTEKYQPQEMHKILEDVL